MNGSVAPVVLHRIIFLAGCAAFGATPAPAQPTPAKESGAESSLPQFTNAADIRRLSPEAAQRQYPVHLRGVVTFTDNFHDRSFAGVVFQDETAGIYVHLPRNMDIAAGQTIEVDGTTGAGGFGPLVRASHCVVVGRAEFPEPKSVQFESIGTGNEDNQWIEVSGTVRAVSAASGPGVYLNLLLTGGGRLQCLVVGADVPSTESLLAARVRLRGACLSRFNRNRQISTPWLGLASPSLITVEKPAPPIPPVSRITHLMQFNADATYGDRVRVRGVVTCIQAGRSIFIQEDGTGLFVQTASQMPVQIGDVVEALGFPVSGQFRPTLEDGVYHLTGEHRAPQIAAIVLEDALSGARDADLVRIQGTLLNRVQRGQEHLLAINSGDGTFTASLRDERSGDALARVENGSVVELTGICLVEKAGGVARISNPIPSFGILLRSPADVVVLAPPKWWTRQKLVVMVLVLLGIVVSVAAWVVVLGRRVRRQTAIIRSKVEQEAVAEERNRLAREFHDTLEQELAAITLQLDAAETQLERSPGRARQLVQVARSMARRSFLEVRRTVWDLRSRFLEANDLPTALAEAVKPLKTDAEVFPRVEVRGTVRPLPAKVEMHLLRIGQEAVTNAIKHAAARNIIVEVEYHATGARLSVVDDGKGFEARESTTVGGGHFGLVDMRERAEKIGSRLEVRSAAGRGTTVIVEIAIANGSSAAEESRA